MADFEDVDFTKDPKYVRGDITPPGEKFAGVREYGDVAPTIDESEYPALVEKMEEDGGGIERLIEEVKDQTKEGSCVGNADAMATEIKGKQQFGKLVYPILSAISLYKRIGSSPNSGANIGDALEESAKNGILPLNNEANKAKYPHTMPATGFRTPFPQGWEETAKRFRTQEWFILKGQAQLMTALLHGHPVVVGRSGHSICYCRPMYRSGKLGVLYVNSWGDWGFGAGGLSSGFGWDSLSMVRSAAQWAFCVRAVVDPQL